MDKKVLIITYDMIPNAASWGGCQRMYYLGEYLTKLGMEVSIFSCKKNNVNTFGNKINFKGIPLEVKNKFFKAFINSKTSQKDSSVKVDAEEKGSLIGELRKKIKNNKFILDSLIQLDSYFFNEPTFLAGPIILSWGKEQYSTIVEYIKENGIKNIVISVPAFHLLVLGEMLKKEFGDAINLIYDYRDPWNMWKRTSKGCYKREKRYIQYADWVVCTNQFLATDTAKEFQKDVNKFKVVSNGYSEEKWSEIVQTKETTNQKMIISYIGSIEIIYSGIRNVEKLINAFRRLSREHNDVELHFVGVNDVTLPTVKALQKEFDNIHFSKTVPARESLEYMNASDVLLLLHTTGDNSSRYIVSGKFYDYARAGKPILSIGSETGIHKKLLEEHKLGLSVINDEDKIYDALVCMYENWKGKSKVFKKVADVSEFSRETQYKKYLDLLV